MTERINSGAPVPISVWTIFLHLLWTKQTFFSNVSLLSGILSPEHSFLGPGELSQKNLQNEKTYFLMIPFPPSNHSRQPSWDSAENINNLEFKKSNSVINLLSTENIAVYFNIV